MLSSTYQAFPIALSLFAASTAAFPHPQASPNAAPQSVQVQTIHEFPTDYSIENLAVRQSGEILATVANHPEIYQVNPVTKETVLAATIPGVNGTLDVVEVEKDIFYTDAGNLSLVTITAAPGSFGLFKIDMRNFDPAKPGSAPVTKVASFPDGDFLNGMVVLNKAAGLILVADSVAGLVWKVNVHTGQVSKAVEDPAMKPDPKNAIFLGINGIKLRGPSLIFDNYDLGTLNSVPIKLDGTAAGPVKTFATGLTGADDFQYDVRGDVFLAQNIPANELGFVKNGADTGTVLAPVRGATAVQFGRTGADRTTLYLTSDAGVVEVDGKNVTIGGRVLKVEVGVEGFSNWRA